MTVVVHKRPKRRRVPTLAELQAEPKADHGPRIQAAPVKAADGSIIRAARTERHERDDPDESKPRVVGSRVRVHYKALFAAGRLTTAAMAAAERYEAMCEAEGGGSGALASLYEPRIRAPQSAQTGVQWTQVQAAAGLRAIHREVGPMATGILRLYVSQNISAAEIGGRIGRDAEAVERAVVATLEKAALFWRMR